MSLPVAVDEPPLHPPSVAAARTKLDDLHDKSISTVVGTHSFPGSGTPEDPYIVDWDTEDPQNPRQWSKRRRWILTLQLSFATWNISFASSSYSGGLHYTRDALHSSRDVAVLGISLYVLGFGVGPLFFAPLSEMYGRRIIFLCTGTPFFILHLGGALATNIQTLVACRFLGGIVGSSPFSNAAGGISDLWNPQERGSATMLYTTCIFLGPVSGPIVGGFISQSFENGWRINFWVMFGLSGLSILTAFFNLSETYAPVLLKNRAKKLQAESGGLIRYASIYESKQRMNKKEALLLNIKRPFVFLLTEPIVTCISLYIGIVYAILYAQFAAFPIVFQEHRHFSPGESGLAFLGIALGQLIGVACTPVMNRLYLRAVKKGGGKAPPEARLFGAMAGAIFVPIGMLWFAWTTYPFIPPIVPILGCAPFAMGMIYTFSSFNSYIMDTYTVYTASAIASTILLRSIFAAAFPLFTPPLFERLGDQWAISLFAFLALLCTPLPFIFFKYGPWIRSMSAYAITDPPVPNDAKPAVPLDDVVGEMNATRKSGEVV